VTFLLEGLTASAASLQSEVGGLILSAAGNLIHIEASDLVPGIKATQEIRKAPLNLNGIATGVALMAFLAHAFPG
jgi:hypothetical protein